MRKIEIPGQFPPTREGNQDNYTYDYYYEMPETGSNQPRNGADRAPKTLKTPWGMLESYYVGEKGH